MACGQTFYQNTEYLTLYKNVYHNEEKVLENGGKGVNAGSWQRKIQDFAWR